eukprot:470547_1
MAALFKVFLMFCILKAIIATRLLPSDESIIHCAGQGEDDGPFINYSNYLNNDTLPAVRMIYFHINQTAQQIVNYFDSLQSQLDMYPNNQWVGLQMGLSFSYVSTQVASGMFDENILEIIKGMKSTNRPFWVRLGYEFNGQWNAYLPKKDYIASFQRITSFFRNDTWSNKYVANVWDWSADSDDLDYESWYPGDKYVDWYGVNIFSDNSSANSHYVTDFAANACKKGFPVMLGECTPRYTGVLNGTTSWDNWFTIYFYELILQHKYCVRQFCYINWNWTSTQQWPDWGDAQIQDNDIVGHNYQTALYKGNYFHSSNETDVLSRLGLTEL